MKVFISWSGEHSRLVAETLRSWIPLLVQSIEPWMSDTDIHPGRRWSHTLAEQLANCDVGLICLTKENLANLWLMFEAGALAKSTERGRLIPICIALDEADLPAPLSMFQAVHLNQEGVRRLMQTLSAADAESKLGSAALEKLFGKLWPDLEGELESKLRALDANKQVALAVKPKSNRELLEELLILTKSSRQPTKKDLLEVIRAWEERLRNEAKRAYEAFEKYDAPTGAVADRFEEFADDLSKVVEIMSKITSYEP